MCKSAHVVEVRIDTLHSAGCRTDCGMHAVQIIAENEKLSSAAYERSRSWQPRLDFNPPDGPMDVIALPEVAAEQRVAGKYHVVLTADGTLYGEWTTLVRGCSPFFRVS